MDESQDQKRIAILNPTVKIELPELNLSSEERDKWMSFYQERMNSTSEVWLKSIYLFLWNWVNEKEVISISTSGSTGAPKLIEVKKSTMIFSAQQSIEYFQFSKNEKWLLFLPAAFVGGQMFLVRAILSGAEVYAKEPKIDWNGEDRVFDFASMIPMQVDKYLEQKSEGKVRRILIGGASIPSSLEKKLKQETETEFFASYGMTETVSHVALRSVNGAHANDYFTGMKNILLGTDDRGCLTVYHKNYSENVLVTNDLVEFDAHERFRIIGRIDNIINSGGLKIVAEDLERKIAEIISQRILVMGLPDEITGEKPVLFIEGPAYDSSTLLILKNHLSENLEKNKNVKGIIFIDKFQETENGKVDRKMTKEIYLKNLRSNL